MRHRETIGTPRADWMLIRIHYLRVVLPLATVCFGAILTLTATAHAVMRVRGFGGDATLPDGLDRIAIVLAGLVALPVGAGVFSRPFKEQHVLLFHALPVSRLRQWALFAISSLLALLTVYAGIALIRPGALEMLTRSNALAIFAMIVAITFAAGLCFAMVFVRTFAVYLAAYIASALVPLLVCVSLFAPQIAYSRVSTEVSTQRLLVELIELPRELSPAILWTWVLVLTLAFAGTSAWFYVRGEMALPRVQLRNALILFAVSAALILTAGPLMYAWPRRSRTVGENGVLPGGRRIVVRHLNLAAPWQSDLTVHDLASGESRTFDVPGFGDLAPLNDRELAIWVRDVSPLRRLMYLRPAHDRIERWSLDGTKIGAEVYDGAILDWYPSASPERGLVVVDEGDVARVYELRGGIRTRELFHAPVPDDVRVTPDLVMFSWTSRDPRVWRIGDDGAHEIPRAPVASKDTSAWIFDGVYYPTRDAVVRRIEEGWPVPRAANEHVAYVFGTDVEWVWAIAADPSTHTAALWRFDVAARTWTRISGAVPLGENELPPPQPAYYGFNTTASMVFNWRSGNALFIERADGRMRHRLHDVARGETVTLLDRAASDPRRLTMRSSTPATPPGSIVISIHENVGPVAEFLWRDGRLEPLPIRPGGDFVRALWPDGTQVRSDGTAYTVTDARGKARRIELARRK